MKKSGTDLGVAWREGYLNSYFQTQFVQFAFHSNLQRSFELAQLSEINDPTSPPAKMKCFVACLLLVVVIVAEIHGASIPTVDKSTEKTTVVPKIVKKVPFKVPIATVPRQARQLGYGNQYNGLQSQLQGISSGYGYGYNNAVGMGGVGQAGLGAGYLPLLGR